MEPGHAFDAVTNVDNPMLAFQTAGADTIGAYRFVAAANRNATTVVEVFGSGAVMEMANVPRRSFNVNRLCALYLRTTTPDCTEWNFSDANDRTIALQLVRERKQTRINGSTLHSLLPAHVDQLEAHGPS